MTRLRNSLFVLLMGLVLSASAQNVLINAATGRTLRFNIRITTPPPGQDCALGVGSSCMFSPKTGDGVVGLMGVSVMNAN